MGEPLLRQHRSRQEPQSEQDQAKRREERDQYVLVALHSSYSEALRQPKDGYNHHDQAQPDGQGGLDGSLNWGTRLDKELFITTFLLYTISSL